MGVIVTACYSSSWNQYAMVCFQYLIEVKRCFLSCCPVHFYLCIGVLIIFPTLSRLQSNFLPGDDKINVKVKMWKLMWNTWNISFCWNLSSPCENGTLYFAFLARWVSERKYISWKVFSEPSHKSYLTLESLWVAFCKGLRLMDFIDRYFFSFWTSWREEAKRICRLHLLL